MQLKFDLSKEYALALEGGGARGAYQIGGWRALREAGVKIKAVSGTSVGALNGAMIAMGDLELAVDVWSNIRYSKVMDVDDDVMRGILSKDIKNIDLKSAAETVRDVVANGGFDVAPLCEWMSSVVDEEKVRASDTELFIVTYSVSDRKELELRAKELEEGKLHDMLLASAYLPVFKNEPLGGKRYTDGGVADVLPVHALFSNGYNDIIAVRLYGFGVERHVKVPKNVKISTISPTIELGSILDFDAEHSRFNMTAGYFDAQRLLYGLAGKTWYIDADWSEEQSYNYLKRLVMKYLSAMDMETGLRELHEKVLPALGKRIDAPKTDYRSLLIALMEEAAEEADIDKWQIYTMDKFATLLNSYFRGDMLSGKIKDALSEKKLINIEIPEIELPDIEIPNIFTGER